MSTSEILACVLSSTLAATVIASIKELVLWRLNRKAKKADEQEIKEDTVSATLTEQQNTIKEINDTIKEINSTITSLQNQISATVKHDKIILRDKIKYLISKYVEYGEITIEEKQAIKHMWDIYHFDLGGNGDLNDWMDILEEIPVKDGVTVAHYCHRDHKETK